MRDYKRLKVWEKAHVLLLNVDRAIRRFPRDYSSLKSQLRRAAESIATNIVEGAARPSEKEFKRFLQISYASCSELEYHLRVARDYGILQHTAWTDLTKDTVEVRMMLAGLLRRVGTLRPVPHTAEPLNS